MKPNYIAKTWLDLEGWDLKLTEKSFGKSDYRLNIIFFRKIPFEIGGYFNRLYMYGKHILTTILACIMRYMRLICRIMQPKEWGRGSYILYVLYVATYVLSLDVTGSFS